MEKTNNDMIPRKRVRGITINEGGWRPLNKSRQEPPPGGKGKGKRPISERDTTPWGPNIPSWPGRFFAFVQTFLADRLLEAPNGSGTVFSSEETPSTDAQVQADASDVDLQTDGVIV